jgi:Tfp pilus assembly protein PilX
LLESSVVPRASRQRGFTIAIVFILMLVMVGVAGGTLFLAQAGLSTVGQDREQAMAFYAAEYAAAEAKAFLASDSTFFSASTGWTYYTTASGNVSWNYCIHNNADDPAYFAPGNPGLCTPVLPSGTTGDTYDTCDLQHRIIVEAYGTAPNNARSRLTVTIGTPALNVNLGASSYAQEANGSEHVGNGGAAEQGVAVGSGITAF